MFRGYSYLFEILGILEILRLAALAQNDGVALLVTLGVAEGSIEMFRLHCVPLNMTVWCFLSP